jgi:hypothetical protein
MRGLRDEKNGFWIGWLTLLVKLQSIIAAHSQLLSKTRSFPYWTTSVFSSTVTDLVLIYESVTSSASIFRWLTLHSWTLNWTTFWVLLQLNHWTPLRVANDWTLLNWANLKVTRIYITSNISCYSVFIATKHPYRTVAQQWIIPYLFAVAGTCAWWTVG